MSNIKPGDLVMVVKPIICCGNTSSIGYVFNPVKVEMTGRFGVCEHCGAISNPSICAHDSGGFAYDLPRLIKIDPPPISEDTTEDLKLHEPA